MISQNEIAVLGQLQPGEEITIVADDIALAAATQEERSKSFTDLVLALSRATMKYGIEVDCSDPKEIKVRKR